MKRHSREWMVLAVWALLLGIVLVAAPSFFQPQPLLTLFARETPTLIVAAGMALVILCRQIDISVASQFAFCGVAAGLLAQAGWPFPLAGLAAVALGALMGAVNGALVAGLGLPSIVVTLATMVAGREGMRWARQGQFLDLPPGVQWLGLSQTQGQWLLIALTALLYVIIGYMLAQVTAGRRLYAVGSDAEASRLAGLQPRWVTFWVFVLLGVLTGFAAVLNVLQSPQVDPRAGLGLELRVIAAVVVGGVAIKGGRGTLFGVFAGALLLMTISPALTHLHVSPFWEKAIQGAIILVAILGDRAASHGKRKAIA